MNVQVLHFPISELSSLVLRHHGSRGDEVNNRILSISDVAVVLRHCGRLSEL